MRFDVTRRYGVLRLVFAVTIAAAAALGGCRSAQVAEPLTETLSGNDPESRLAFWHTLADRNVTSNDEAFHALLLLADGADETEDYADRVALLQSRRMLPQGFDRRADEAVRRGTLAVAIARILDIKGGLTMRLAGSTPRYATRELQYMLLFPAGSPHQTMAGSELLSVIGRAEDYRRQTAAAPQPEQPTAEQ